MHELKAINRIFNIVAEFIRFVFDCSKPDVFDDLRIKTDCKFDQDLRGFLFDEKGSVPISSRTDIDGLERLLKRKLDKYIKDMNVLDAVLLIQLIDKSCNNIISDFVDEIQLFKCEYNYLNTNFDVTNIALLPNVGCKWEQNSAKKNRSHNINALLKNYYSIDITRLEGMQVSHFFVEERNFIDRTELSIGISPLWKWKSYEAKYENKDGLKTITPIYIGDRETENQVVYNTMIEAQKRSINILVMPEMHGNTEMQKYLMRMRYKNPSAVFPEIAILPSVWNNNANCSSVVGRNGNIIFNQYKYHPYINDKEDNKEENGKENLVINSHIINVIHIRGIGRIVVMICRDFLELHELQIIMETIRPTLILVPSYSTGDYDFNSAKGIAESYECCVAWINSCAISKNLNRIGFFLLGGHSCLKGERKYKDVAACNMSNSVSICNAYCKNNICIMDRTLSLLGKEMSK